jgi:hypothetical protein
MKKIALLLLLLNTLYGGELDKDKQGFGISYGIMGVGVSYFDRVKNSELFATVMYYSDDIYEKDYNEDTAQKEIHLSLHYRKFFKEQVSGFYYGGFARYSYLEGKIKNKHQIEKQSKVGLGAEVGYTSFGLLNYPTLYWNVGIGLGPYLNGDHEIYEDDDLLGHFPLAVHMDLLRIGLVF